MKKITLSLLVLMLSACMQDDLKWHLMLKHDEDGQVLSGSTDQLISAIRGGCALRIAWGARSTADPDRTIEHVATPLWVAVRNGNSAEVQLDDYLINLGALGQEASDHPRLERFGGTQKAVMWRVNFKTDGSFDAVWYDHATGAFIERVPQTHQGSWFADCVPGDNPPLYSEG